jgi:hypothetical protein
VLLVVVVLDSQKPSPDGRRRERGTATNSGESFIERSPDPGTIGLRFGDAPDGRRQIGGTPAGGDAGTTQAPREQPQPPPHCWPDEARDSVPTDTPDAGRCVESDGRTNKRSRSSRSSAR